MDKLKPLRSNEKKQRSPSKTQAQSHNDSKESFIFEDLDTTSKPTQTSSKFFTHSPLETQSQLVPPEKSGTKRLSDSPLSPKERRIRSRSDSSQLNKAELGKSLPSKN